MKYYLGKTMQFQAQGIQVGTKIGCTDNQQVIKFPIQDSCFSPPKPIFVFRGIEKLDFVFLRIESGQFQISARKTDVFKLVHLENKFRSP